MLASNEPEPIVWYQQMTGSKGSSTMGAGFTLVLSHPQLYSVVLCWFYRIRYLLLRYLLTSVWRDRNHSRYGVQVSVWFVLLGQYLDYCWQRAIPILYLHACTSNGFDITLLPYGLGLIFAYSNIPSIAELVYTPSGRDISRVIQHARLMQCVDSGGSWEFRLTL